MGIKIIGVEKAIESTGLKILVYGRAGAGKTVLATTTGEPTLILSAESGLLSIKEAKKYIKGFDSRNLKVAVIKNFDDLDDMYEYLYDEAIDAESIDDLRYKWIYLDSITEIAERILAFEKKEAKDPRQAYGVLQDRMLEIIKKFRDLPLYNVVMSSKMQYGENETGVKTYAPMMPGAKLYQQIPYLFDEVFALRVENDEDGSEFRVIQTKIDRSYEAKDRSGKLDDFEDANLKAIKKKIQTDQEDEEKEVEEKQHKVEIDSDEHSEAEVSENQESE